MKFSCFGTVLKEFKNRATFIVNDKKQFQEIAHFHTINFLNGCDLIKGIKCDYLSLYKLFYLSLEHSFKNKMLYHTISLDDNSNLSGLVAMKSSTKEKLKDDLLLNLKENYSIKLDIILDLMDKLSSPISLKNPSYVLCMSADSSKYKGLGTELVEVCINDFRNNGYDGFYSEATGSKSKRIFEKFGAKCLNELHYSTYDFERERVFSENNQGKFCLMELNFKL